MERFKLMTNEEYFAFVNNSTFISNLNQGQIIVPGLQNMQQKFNPMENVSSINNNQQSNYSSFEKGYGNAK
tara:strand:- start:9 stop:221 length:213 start_codon:yes stop_codon:yes gene_type:complete